MTNSDISIGFFCGVAFTLIVLVMLIAVLHPWQCEGLAGSYVQTMKNCIVSHDFNSSWCTVEWLK